MITEVLTFFIFTVNRITTLGSKIHRKSHPSNQRDDVHVCIMCLRAIMNYQVQYWCSSNSFSPCSFIKEAIASFILQCTSFLKGSYLCFCSLSSLVLTKWWRTHDVLMRSLSVWTARIPGELCTRQKCVCVCVLGLLGFTSKPFSSDGTGLKPLCWSCLLQCALSEADTTSFSLLLTTSKRWDNLHHLSVDGCYLTVAHSVTLLSQTSSLALVIFCLTQSTLTPCALHLV